MTALHGLPTAVLRMLPELAELHLPEETLADCARCTMVPRAGEPRAPWHFDDTTRCCTYHPDLANYLAGRALRRGGAGAALVRQRIDRREGVTPRVIHAPQAWRARYEATREVAFGRDVALRCPYWAGGELSCGVWLDRNSVCRTWFCKSTGGWPMQRAWTALRSVLARVEMDLAAFCTSLGDPPDDDASTDTWVRWYTWCAEAVDHIRPDAATRLRTNRVEALLAHLAEAVGDLDGEATPEVLVPTVQEVRPLPDRLALCGYSRFDEVEVPTRVFEFLGRLDGTTPWRVALTQARAAGCDLTEDDVHRLYAIRAVKSPSEADDPYAGLPPSPHDLVASLRR